MESFIIPSRTGSLSGRQTAAQIAVRHQAVLVSLFVTLLLTAMKLAAAGLSGSVSVLSEALHSSLDLVTAIVAYYTVREAGKPADEDHPFGHGKFETLSSLLEGVLMVAAAVFIVYEGMERLLSPQDIGYPGVAIATLFVSLFLSWYAYRNNLRASEITDSNALQINALHFLADVVACVGILIGLVVLKFTGWTVIDPIMAFAVALYIVVIAFGQLRKALRELTDTTLPESEMADILKIVHDFEDRYQEFHELRTRKSGPVRHIDFHLVACREMTVSESHDLCDEIEGKLQGRFPNSSVSIHVEPCHHHEAEPTCHLSCEIYQGRIGERGGKDA